MPKEVLIDLSALKYTNSGLCNVAHAFAEGFSRLQLEDLKFIFLVPPAFVGKFGDAVDYTVTSYWRKRFSFLLPKVDLWHSTLQAYRYVRISRTTPQILTVHDLNFLYEKRPAKARSYLRKMQKKINKASAVVAISQFVAEDMVRHLNLKNTPLRVIYNAVDRLETREYRQPQFVANLARPFFFSIGQMRAKKNFHVLLDVMKSFPEIDLYLCGGEQERSYGQMIAKRILEENITNVFLAGSIAEPEKIWMYRHCDAFLFPSKFEGFGLPMLEAMQFGKPVFASPMTSLPEVAGGQAFIWDNFETAHMVELIQRHRHQDAAQIERIKAHAYSFNLERHTQEYLQLYRELLALRG